MWRNHGDEFERGTKAAYQKFTYLENPAKLRYQKDGFDIDLSYITPRLMAMGCPYDVDGFGRGKTSSKEIARFLETKYNGHYKIWDLTLEKYYDVSTFAVNSVVRHGFDDHHAPPLAVLWPIVKDIISWWQAHPLNVAVVHCMAGRGRTGVVCCALLLCTGVAKSAEHAKKIYASRRGAPVRSGSQQRYIGYVAQQIRETGAKPTADVPALLFPPVAKEVLLTQMRFVNCPDDFVPVVELVSLDYPHENLCGQRVFPNATTLRHTRTVPVGTVLSGDVLVRVYEEAELDGLPRKDYVLKLAFNTHFVGTNPAIPERFNKAMMDGAFSGSFYLPRFASSFAIEFTFAPPTLRPKL